MTGLTLHSLQRDIQIKMLTLQMEQLMFKRLFLLKRGETRIYIYVKTAVAVRNGYALDSPGHVDQTYIIISCHGAEPQ